MRTPMLAGLALLWSGAAAAQDQGFDAHGFAMMPNDGDVRDPMTVLRAGNVHQGEFWFSGVFDYSDDTLVRELTYSDGRPSVTQKVVDSLAAINLSAGIAVHDRLRLDVGMPLYVAATSDGASTGGGIGDIRLGAYTPIVRTKPRQAGGFGLGIAPYLYLPTGDEARFLGQQGLTGGIDLGATYELEMLTFSAAVGPRFNPAVEVDNQQGFDQLVVGGAIGLNPIPQLGINIESRLASSLGETVGKGTASPAELLGSLRYRLDNGLNFQVGAGTGISPGTGASAYRVIAGIGFGKIELNFEDRDLDGIVNERDACPDDPEVYNAFEDEDGCPDAGGRLLIRTMIDDVPEGMVYVTVSGGEANASFDSTLEAHAIEVPAGSYDISANIPGFQGNEQVNVVAGEYPITVDMQAVIPGTVNINVTDANGNSVPSVGLSIIGPGAPLDATRRLGPEGLADYELPPGRYLVYLKAEGIGMFRQYVNIASYESETVNAVLRDPRAKVEGDRITVTEKIFFETGSDVIQTQSHDLLAEIATLLVSEPRVRSVEIQGHTDAEGSDEMNLDLSRRRAEAVRSFLMRQGVEGGRLSARGFGEQVPIADNETEVGRARNRRVEFRILEMD